MMLDLKGEVNAGYEIVTQGEQSVVGYTRGKDEWVAWNYSIRDGEVEYYWGRYGTREYVYGCFNKKENGQYSGN